MLLRDAAYQMLPKETRAGLHERFADWLEARPAVTDPDEFVGYHLEQAHVLRLELGPEDDDARSVARRAADRLVRGRQDVRGTAAIFRASENLHRRAAALAAPWIRCGRAICSLCLVAGRPRSRR